MCGIFGSYRDQQAADCDMRFQGALHALHHRGPDDQGLEFHSIAGGQLALGHTRLSIIDLSAGGHQPMHSLDGRHAIVFNGEIYNYRELRQELKRLGHAFHTDSDTEVLLTAWSHWGLEALPKLRGMFAFAVWDRSDQTLTLVRDAFGIKPLFYRQDPDGFAFASEIPALLALLPQKPALNLQRAYSYLVFGDYDSGEDTFYAGIYHLPPGHWLRLDLKEGRIGTPQRWWWPSIEERTDLSFEDAAAHLRELFLDNMRLHLRSDVPLGAALSGGVDSSAIVCAMRHIEPEMPIHTFTFIAPGTSVDEEKWADIINQTVKAIPHKVDPGPNDLARDFDDLIKEQGEPFGSTSLYAGHCVYKEARNNGIVVTLDGQGGDELFAGYHGYPNSRIKSLIDSRQFLTLTKFLIAWGNWPGRVYKNAIVALAANLIPDKMLNHLKRLRTSRMKDWLNAEYFLSKGISLYSLENNEFNAGGSIDGRALAYSLRRAQTETGLQSLLRHVDRNAMHWSIENRVPFLTTDLAEFALSLPESYLVSNMGETKSVFRAAMKGIVPNAILDRKDKIGFAPPEKKWIYSNKKQLLAWVEFSSQIPFFESNKVRSFINAQLGDESVLTGHTWRIINFCRWCDINNPTMPDC